MGPATMPETTENGAPTDPAASRPAPASRYTKPSFLLPSLVILALLVAVIVLATRKTSSPSQGTVPTSIPGQTSTTSIPNQTSTTIGNVQPLSGPEVDYAYGRLTKNADSMKGMRVTGVSCIFQFDAVTGNQNFLGYYDDAGGSSFDLVNVNLPSASVGNGIYQGDKVRYH